MPTTSSKVPAAVKEVEDRKVYWLKKRDEAKEKGFVAEDDAASSSKPKQPNGVAKGRGPNPTLDLTTEEWPGEGHHSLAPVIATASRSLVEGFQNVSRERMRSHQALCTKSVFIHLDLKVPKHSQGCCANLVALKMTCPSA